VSAISTQGSIQGSTTGSTTGTQAVDRAAKLLELVVQADEAVSFTELSDEAGLARSTTSRLLAALESRHLLDRDGSGAFVPGALFALYAARHDPSTQIARLAQPTLQELSASTGETVNLAVSRGDTVVQIAQVNATYMLGARDWMHVTVPPHCSALGKVLYAYGCLSIPEGDLVQLTKRSLATSRELMAELTEIRSQGFASTRSELEVGLDAVAAPVFGRTGDVVAALGVSGPSARLGSQLDRLGHLVKEQGDALSQLLRRRMRKEGTP
jgi:DNA-binding IclR family transcriptional regulator